jgi:hypothetical protein
VTEVKLPQSEDVPEKVLPTMKNRNLMKVTESQGVVCEKQVFGQASAPRHLDPSRKNETQL